MYEKLKKIVETIDQKGMNFFNKKQIRFITYFMKFISELFDTFGFSFVSSCFMIVVIYSDTKIKEPFLLLAISQISTYIFKRIFGRKRPFTKFDWVHLITKPPKDVFSFPSGHTTASFSLAFAIKLTFPELFPFFLIVAILCGISRIYLGVHYPTDVLIGAMIPIIIYNIIIYTNLI